MSTKCQIGTFGLISGNFVVVNRESKLNNKQGTADEEDYTGLQSNATQKRHRF